MDMVVPGLLLAQAIGRWGNYFNMEAYGPEITNPAFQFFPLGVLIPSAGGYVWHMATFFTNRCGTPRDLRRCGPCAAGSGSRVA